MDIVELKLKYLSAGFFVCDNVVGKGDVDSRLEEIKINDTKLSAYFYEFAPNNETVRMNAYEISYFSLSEATIIYEGILNKNFFPIIEVDGDLLVYQMRKQSSLEHIYLLDHEYAFSEFDDSQLIKLFKTIEECLFFFYYVLLVDSKKKNLGKKVILDNISKILNNKAELEYLYDMFIKRNMEF